MPAGIPFTVRSQFPLEVRTALCVVLATMGLEASKINLMVPVTTGVPRGRETLTLKSVDLLAKAEV